jgi:hypothetical protein
VRNLRNQAKFIIFVVVAMYYHNTSGVGSICIPLAKLTLSETQLKECNEQSK